jgi:hypothetical protein
MGEIIEFPSRRVQFYAELERGLEQRFSEFPPELAQRIKNRLIERTKQLELKVPSFTIELPSGTSSEAIRSLREQIRNAQSTTNELIQEILLLEMKLLISEAGLDSPG